MENRHTITRVRPPTNFKEMVTLRALWPGVAWQTLSNAKQETASIWKPSRRRRETGFPLACFHPSGRLITLDRRGNRRFFLNHTYAARSTRKTISLEPRHPSLASVI